MEVLSPAQNYPGAVLGILCAGVGAVLQGVESSVLWGLIGYFVGKSIQSTLWTITGERTS
jgi:hypothetical protein